jgi:nicotinate phosphoribosyltransferase
VTDPERARRWTGLRQDSGDPFAFGPRVKEVYESLGIDPREKLIIYSDSLSVDKALRLRKQASELGLEKGTY